MSATHCPRCGKSVPGINAPTFTPSLREACKHTFDMLLSCKPIPIPLATLELSRKGDGSVRINVVEGKGAIAELDTMGRLGGTLPIDYVNKLVVEAAGHLTEHDSLFRQACERIFDMLLADNGQAWFEAERFLKAHAPDLYNRIGMPKEKKDE